jgi:DNA invertase Pin-like site-specific DNA recombinase
MKRAFSYIRFSRSHQEDGDSLRRQTHATEEYCRRHNLILDDSLKLRDLGISAFKGRNAESGALHRFISECERGVVPKGSALIVESLDRLSRQSPRKTVKLLTQLLDDHGIEVHLTMAGKVFKPECEEGNDLIIAVALAMRAHEESETKSRRLSQAFAKKREAVTEATKTGKRLLMTKSLPWWLVLKNGKIVSPPERAKIVREIFRRVAAGESSNRIAYDFNRRKIPTWRPTTKHWMDSRVRDLVNAEAPLGTLTETPKTRKEGRTWRIENYYPRVVSDDIAADARASLKRNRKGGRPRNNAKPANLLKSLIRYKGIWMRFNVHERVGPNGPYWNGYYDALYPDRPGSAYMIAANQVEPILLASLAELTPDELAPPVTTGSRVDALKKTTELIQQRIENVGAAIEAGSVSMAPRLIALERELAEARLALDQNRIEQGLTVDSRALETVQGVDIADLKNTEKRPLIAAAIRRIIQRIDIGSTPSDLTNGPAVLELEEGDTMIEEIIPDPTGTRGKHPVVMLVHFRGGATRLIARGVADYAPIIGVETARRGKKRTSVEMPKGILTVRVAKPGDKIPVM